jgi:hypothetical protein
VLVDKGALDRRMGWREAGEDCGQLGAEQCPAACKVGAARRTADAVFDMRDSRAGCVDYAPAGIPEARVDPDDALPALIPDDRGCAATALLASSARKANISQRHPSRSVDAAVQKRHRRRRKRPCHGEQATVSRSESHG